MSEYYDFQEQHAYDFARHVHIKAFPKGDELRFQKCPYCGNSTNDKDTFAINLKTGQFKCLRDTCGAHGNMITLSKDFDFSLGSYVDEYYRPKKEYRTLPTPKEPIKPKDPAIKYLSSRGISEEVAKRYQITTQTGKDNILVFPFFDETGTLVFVKYRKTDFKKGVDKNKEWCEADCKPILYGMDQCNPENKTLVITEGQLDSLSVTTAGIENAVSVPTGAKGFTWIPYCWNFVQKFEKIIVFGDHEKGHITLLDEIKSHFSDKLVMNVRPEDYGDCKDANEILQRYGVAKIRTCIQNAKTAKVDYILNAADIELENDYDCEKLRTGFRALDENLKGGLAFPGLVVITGKRGEGKSTVGSQILLEAVEQDYKCFAYSGELSAKRFMSWFTRQAAGPGHVFKYKTKFGTDGYNISEGNRKAIKEWVNEKLYVFDNRAITEEPISLIRAIEDSIIRYGVRVILLDNLMTALSRELDGSSDKYDMQSRFTLKLAELANRRNVLIILVAHKKKNTTYDELDDIAGSSDIANLTSAVISYGRDKDLPPQQRAMKLLKERIFGNTNFDGWAISYDERSKRLTGDRDLLDREYGWNKTANEFRDPLPSEELPFD